MIELTDKLPELINESPAYIKIVSTDYSYRKMAEYNLYAQEKKGYISLLSRSAILYGDFCDYKEIREFLGLFADNVFCDESVAEKLGISGETCVVMKKNGNGGTKEFEPFMPFSTKELYDKLCYGLDGDIVLPEYEAFAADFALRYRRATAYAVTNDFGCAAAPFITRNFALISGVCVKKECRFGKKGKALLLKLCERLGNRTVMLCCKEDNVPFYEKCGFTVSGQARYCELV